jgi:hypothetical protein
MRAEWQGTVMDIKVSKARKTFTRPGCFLADTYEKTCQLDYVKGGIMQERSHPVTVMIESEAA